MALLSVVLGNRYGVAWNAQNDAKEILKRLTSDRWQYYLNNVLPSDTRILGKLLDDNPRSNWISLTATIGVADLEVKSRVVGQLLTGNAGKVEKAARKLIDEYYGKAT